METLILRCPSVTYAQKGQVILEKAGYRARLTRLGAHGCAYGLEINAPDRSEITRLLKEAGVIFTF
jgi:hypothetical protein